MRKYENVDVTAALGAVMEINTEHYKSDFQYDIEMFQRAAAEPDGNNNHLIWFSRQSGTECFLERNTHIKETSAYNTCQYYADTKDTILAYAVEITGMENGKPMGNLYELDYRKQAAQLKQAAHTPTEVTLFLADGTEKRLPYDEYKNSSGMSLTNRYGTIERLRFEVADERSLQQLLKQARNDRQKYRPAVFKSRNSSRKPTIRAQLTEGKAAAAPHKAAAQTKSQKAEVSL